MTSTYDNIASDIERIRQIPIVSTILDVVCQTTGMGFAAVARVTEDRWVACCVKDDINFGLQVGGDLKLDTTICNEIRGSGKSVIIDHVDTDPTFCNHHTPKMYGFQSYISVPIVLKNGEFFGTLCAIDPNPASLNNSKITGMFTIFAELISFHLHNIDLMERLNKELSESLYENRQYHQISNHNLQEPLRKIKLFSNMLVNAAEIKDVITTKELALKVNTWAQKISLMINDLSDFSELNYSSAAFENVDLNDLLKEVCAQLKPSLEAKNAIVDIQNLPIIKAVPFQMEQAFYHLIDNAIRFSINDVPSFIQISHREIDSNQLLGKFQLESGKRYYEIKLSVNATGMDESQLRNIFDISAQLRLQDNAGEAGLGLAYCRKIIRNHGGIISAETEQGVGITFFIVLPIIGTASKEI